MPAITPTPPVSNPSAPNLIAASTTDAAVVPGTTDAAIEPITFEAVLAAQCEASVTPTAGNADLGLGDSDKADVASDKVLDALASEITASTQLLAQNAPPPDLQAQMAAMLRGQDTTVQPEPPNVDRGKDKIAVVASDDAQISLTTPEFAQPLQPSMIGSGVEEEQNQVLMVEGTPVEMPAAQGVHGGARESSAPNAAGRASETQEFNPRHIPEPVKSSAWGEALGQRVVWMAKENVQVVRLQVEPPNLGPLEVQLRLSNDQANVVFMSAHAAVRDAIAGSLPKLDALLSANGVSLGSVSVNTQSQPQQQGQQSGSGQWSSGPSGWHADLDLPTEMIPMRKTALVGMVDTFA